MFVTPNRKRIKELREQANLSMNALSKKAKLSSVAILRIENGITKRTSNLRAEAIAAALGCDVKEIFQYPDREKVG